jgi:hypothetical protein
MSKSDQKQYIFLREDQRLGDPGDPVLLGYGFKIPDHSIDV